MELHLVSRRSDQRAWEHFRARINAGAMVEVVLLHDAVLETEASLRAVLESVEPSKLVLMACADDAKRRQIEERWALIDYPGIIDRCATAEKVITW
jgi:sulfur transfer complex TusBCD TusB component (DsrH family)